ncbi:phenylalanine-4-hydroxylase-like [Acanthaster planci]|uniref:phenylalanine 4-monooxygenase n=1 Tax=Acanthaster planci TaxID=133434 RepID=A0A8B7ZGZ7_ACAPL|nr:phenylalanine-4-hydroxylase-like [Acanthaster planci]XP_022104923.1 phenylalanine-4-hydroxylase-like [Acanthaster planci]
MSEFPDDSCCVTHPVADGSDEVEFPRNFAELDYSLTREVYDVIQPNVKGFDDAKYRSFRRKCQLVTKTYKLGTPIPSMIYPASQLETWARTYNRLMLLYPMHACTKFNNLLAPFLEACDISAHRIPDLEKVSNYLRRKTGFRLRPVSTFMTPRDFLAALAFRVFCSSQYVRHGDGAFFTNEPDVIHEILGHAVLLCDAEFAQFSQDIGLASLGTPDHILDKIASVYMSTVEAGLCREGSEVKAYGALLLSGSNELEHVFTDKAVKRPLEIEAAASLPDIDLDKYQDVYYVSESIEEAEQMARAYVSSLPCRMSVKYNPEKNVIEPKDKGD